MEITGLNEARMFGETMEESHVGVEARATGKDQEQRVPCGILVLVLKDKAEPLKVMN